MIKKEQSSSQEALKNAGLSTGFFSKVTPELRSPVHGIRGIANYLDKNWENVDDDIKSKCASDIVDAIKILGDINNSLIEQFKNSNNTINYTFAEANLITVSQEVIKQRNLVTSFNKKTIIDFKCDIKVCTATIDVFWFKILLSNLIINAIKFSLNEGKVTVTIEEILYQAETAYLFSVSDEGIGIADSDLKKIFKPYSKSLKNGPGILGVGLGLAICTEVVSGHGGKISAKNNNTAGATIEFIMPKRKIK